MPRRWSAGCTGGLVNVSLSPYRGDTRRCHMPSLGTPYHSSFPEQHRPTRRSSKHAGSPQLTAFAAVRCIDRSSRVAVKSKSLRPTAGLRTKLLSCIGTAIASSVASRVGNDLLVPPNPLTTLAALQPEVERIHTQHHVTLLNISTSFACKTQNTTLKNLTNCSWTDRFARWIDSSAKLAVIDKLEGLPGARQPSLKESFFFLPGDTHGNKNLNISTAFIGTSIIHNLHRRNAAKAQRNARSKPGETSPLFLFLLRRIVVDQSLCRWSTGAATTAGTPWRSTGTWPQSCCTILGARMSWAGRAKKTDERKTRR